MSREVICKAIAARALLSFTYAGKQRRVEPHILGHAKDGELTLCAWQLQGGSGVGFRDFHVQKASNFVASDETFPEARPGYNPNDTTLATVICRLQK